MKLGEIVTTIPTIGNLQPSSYFINFSILKCHNSSVAIHQNSVNRTDEMLFFYWQVWGRITCNLWKSSINQVSMWRQLNTKTSVSLYGTLVVRIKFDLCGDTISRILMYVLNSFVKFKSCKSWCVKKKTKIQHTFKYSFSYFFNFEAKLYIVINVLEYHANAVPFLLTIILVMICFRA